METPSDDQKIERNFNQILSSIDKNILHNEEEMEEDLDKNFYDKIPY